MKIETFLKKINYKVLSGEIYSGELLKDKLLYWIHFTDKIEKNKGKLLISAVNQQIYYVQYEYELQTYIYFDKLITTEEFKNVISKRKMLFLLEKN